MLWCCQKAWFITNSAQGEQATVSPLGYYIERGVGGMKTPTFSFFRQLPLISEGQTPLSFHENHLFLFAGFGSFFNAVRLFLPAPGCSPRIGLLHLIHGGSLFKGGRHSNHTST